MFRPGKLSNIVFLSIVILIGGFLRFYKLDWGEGYFFHPDERNITSVSVSITPPLDAAFFTKGTFAYGNLIPYLAYMVNFFVNLITPDAYIISNFSSVTLLLRMISATFSVLTIIISYLIGKKFWHKRVGYLAASITTFSPGLIQSAHFGTFEATLVFLYLLVFYFSASLITEGRVRNFFFSILSLGLASAIKINSLILLPPLLFALFLSKKLRYGFKEKIIIGSVGFAAMALMTILFSPYYLTSDFRRMVNYEQQLVRGETDVFYTRQFFNTKPILFQLTKITPFITNHLVTIFFPVLFFYLIYNFLKKIIKNRFFSRTLQVDIFLIIFVSALFVPHALLFTKWTRYMIPTIPFLILLVMVGFERFVYRWRTAIYTSLILTSVVWTSAFMSVYLNRDTRLAASEWIYQNIADNSYLLSETGNVFDIPIPPKEKVVKKKFTVKNFDFYNLEKNNVLFNELIIDLERADYILIPSRRIFGGMGSFPDKHPLVVRYYQLLFSEKLGFKEIKRFTSYPRLLSFEFPDEIAEETWSVFDHPVVRIYKKVSPMNTFEYEKLLKI